MKQKHTIWTKFDPARLRPAPKWMKNPIPCPQCKGHTSCITHEDAYGVGNHQEHACSQCGGMCPMGWVEADSVDATCIHEFSQSIKLGNCYYQYKCSKCGKTQNIDSGG